MKLSFQSWIYFSFFLISNVLLSYFPLSLTLQIWIFTFGVLIPFGAALWIILEKRRKEPSPATHSTPVLIDIPNDSTPPMGLWIVFILLILFTRLYRLTSIPFWPVGDEGIYSTIALSTMKKWNWTLLLTQGRMDPLLIWFMGLFFRIDSPSLVSLRLFTTIFSIATALLSYFCVRPYLPRSTAFIFCWLSAFSFWEFSLMRFSTHQVLILFFEILGLGSLGYYLKSKKPICQQLWMTALICCNILGFYSYINWSVIWFFMLLVLIIFSFQKPSIQKTILYFFLITVLSILPLVLARLAPSGLSYINAIFDISNIFSSFFRYLKNIFYDCKTCYPYAPDWGGMFDPVTSSLILIGVLYSFKKLGKKLLCLLGFGLFICLLPGVLTNYVELHRITPSLPFWMLLAALGTESLFSKEYPHRIWPWFAILGILSLGINVFNFVGPYCDLKRAIPERQWRVVEYEDAYRLLKHQSEETGPLYVFLEFYSDYSDKTINLAVYPFNCIENPALKNVAPRFAAIMADVNYTPFFVKNFPDLKMKILKTDNYTNNAQSPYGMFIVPVSQISPSILKNWIAADRIYRTTDRILLNKTSVDTWSQLYESTSQIQNLCNNDPFLTAVYWEKYGYLKFYDGDYQAASTAYKTAVKKGIPAAQLYYGLGVCLKKMNKDQEANKAFQKANLISNEISNRVHN